MGFSGNKFTVQYVKFLKIFKIAYLFLKIFVGRFFQQKLQKKKFWINIDSLHHK